MGNAQRPQVNQRLYFARLHRDWLEQQLAAEQLPRTIVEQALGESFILHLMMAYRAYLAEIAEAYQLGVTDVESAQALSRAMHEQGIHCAECEELLGLEQANHWPGLLVRYFQHIGTGTEALKVRPSQTGIQLQVIDSETFNVEQLRQIHDQMQALIEKQRGCLEEW